MYDWMMYGRTGRQYWGERIQSKAAMNRVTQVPKKPAAHQEESQLPKALKVALDQLRNRRLCGFIMLGSSFPVAIIGLCSLCAGGALTPWMPVDVPSVVSVAAIIALMIIIGASIAIEAEIKIKKIGTGSGARTHTMSPSPDFESGASTSSAIPAQRDA